MQKEDLLIFRNKKTDFNFHFVQSIIFKKYKPCLLFLSLHFASWFKSSSSTSEKGTM